MADIVVENPYKFYLMILIVGLVVAFGVGAGTGFVAGYATHQPAVVEESPLPRNYDLAKVLREQVENCRYMGEAVALLKEQTGRVETQVKTAVAELKVSCQSEQKKKITH